MRHLIRLNCGFAFACAMSICAHTTAVELTVLTPENWDEFAPHGKEVDCIYGDYVIRNDKFVAVIAKDVDTRNANMTVRNVGGCIIDLTGREQQSDQLSAYYPVSDRRLRITQVGVALDDGVPAHYQDIDISVLADRLSQGSLKSNSMWMTLQAQPQDGQPEVNVMYTIQDGDPRIHVETTFTNTGDEVMVVDTSESMRVDGEFSMGLHQGWNLFWAYDAHWGQAYGIRGIERRTIAANAQSLERRRPIIFFDARAQQYNLKPGEENALSVIRRVFAAPDTVALKALAQQGQRPGLTETNIQIVDPRGPVVGAEIKVQSGEEYGRGKTDEGGKWTGMLPPGVNGLEVVAQGREPFKIPFVPVPRNRGTGTMKIELPAPAYVMTKITDESGEAIPCKIAFFGTDGTRSPNFGPDSAIHGVQNLWYSHNGTEQIEIAPGSYEVVVSYGPEYDALQKKFDIKRGDSVEVSGKLVRSVDTTGWLSAEYHSHSTPSGDNTSSQRGRVLNLLAEHLEFIPCTEHNRIDTYVPHLEHFDAVNRVITCSGMELTGRPLPVNHQNAFPLMHTPRTQDGGGPVTDNDPIVQIQRLAYWDDKSEKLVQINHPNLPLMLGDRDYDGTPDAGFEKMFGFADVIEVHPPADIFTPPSDLPPTARDLGNRIFHWMQMLNVGYRVPGVVNTDAHWNFHGSGWIRNYVKSDTDDPAKASVADLVHATEHGNLVMSNGPFLEVTASAGPNGNSVDVGDDLSAQDGYVKLHIRVQCPNWHTVNRVQVFVNGQPREDLNFRMNSHPDMFAKSMGSTAVRFEQEVDVRLEKDAHLIVATIGEGEKLGRVMGGPHAEDAPVAVTNPIFVDVDGSGFAPNGDMLGVPLRLPEGNTPSHGHSHRH